MNTGFPIFGYIDPGTGSYLLQLLIAGLVGGAFAVKVFWRNITATIARLFRGTGRVEKER